ncbi:MAG: radical SAM protein [Candidatus Schekmanbacteria bacterium RIFCSPHIGHO2_02_FULL_38_11]|uniref:Radical SAM protein n=1 Tax=Candidatus Schekmanbacteria bacterium RIFCSPLOWO2_12_FULL_38_15 TaxID=1817883 RepID=A0A1F7SL73_9BACT|nr:MAG: radical SAM protein [Candidatus Schekmanbacteria bacterium GWA2_38_9]OGL51214.1 MAG: radical SAM protein [Candidatus Schekmanbacteria bacterium RIFCSPHIGHO2_02_FULL_38_11]OGL51775.1 MAG: radical SAM protein [Candidatus Schekmanbacteria bacterium RIFCSPLOWO2_02_FULL_38_14]OGL53988.1 MAG: radical SAM protein [Candidatus Schekmanbacteria bacterium RIFCSPLOWO2_12_FULL_38_15]
MKMLLTSIFGPFGVDDQYGEKENKMELFHNQVTREQGVFSYRFNHASHGLYFIAENIDVPTTVLDFPTLRRFKKELKKGYDYIGISFIVSNFEKAKKMAQLVREISPDSKIVLGGHGVNIPNIENMIEHDFICYGEGLGFLRNLFNEDQNKPIKHPLSYSSFNREVMGVPWAANGGILITGVGCSNKCRFCSTSHFFGEYIPYLKTGKEIFDVCCEYEDKLGITDFGVLDENFLKSKDRALELLEIMEKEGRYFAFAIFSSAETLADIGDLDILVRLGINFIWIGVESKKEIYEKNKGTDFHNLFKELKRRGISVMASAILFLEDHDKETIWDDIKFVTSLNPDYLQFMQLVPVPGTTLYKNYKEKEKLLPDVPLLTQHGQKNICFHHEHFTPDESNEFLKEAFIFDYQKNGPSLIRAIQTSLQGYEYCINHTDPRIKLRVGKFKSMLEMMRCFLFGSRIFCQNDVTKNMLAEIRKTYNKLLGKTSIKTFALSLIFTLFSVKEYLRITFFTDVRQPKTFYKKIDKSILKSAEQETAPDGNYASLQCER